MEKHIFIKKKTNVVICKICVMYVFLPIEDTNYISNKCKPNKLLEEKVKDLEVSLASLRFKQQNEKLQLKEDYKLNILKNKQLSEK